MRQWLSILGRPRVAVPLVLAWVVACGLSGAALVDAVRRPPSRAWVEDNLSVRLRPVHQAEALVGRPTPDHPRPEHVPKQGRRLPEPLRPDPHPGQRLGRRSASSRHDFTTGESCGSQAAIEQDDLRRVELRGVSGVWGDGTVLSEPHQTILCQRSAEQAGRVFARRIRVVNATKRGLGAEKVYLNAGWATARSTTAPCRSSRVTPATPAAPIAPSPSAKP